MKINAAAFQRIFGDESGVPEVGGHCPPTWPTASNGPSEPRAPLETIPGADPSELDDDAPTQPFVRV